MSSTKLLNERPLIVLPGLATQVGLNRAIFLQQLHWRSLADSAQEGVARSLEQWERDFPFWSKRTVQRVIQSLLNDGFLHVIRQRQSSVYRIDYAVLGAKVASPEWPDRHVESGQPGASPSMRETATAEGPSSLRSEADGDGFEMRVQDPPEPSALFDEPTEEDKQIADVWNHYCERSTPVSTELTVARKRMIRHALKECTVEECKLAIDGNRLSSWHRERGKHHLSDVFGRPKPPTTLRAKIDRFIGDAQRSGSNLAPLASATMTGFAREMKEAVITAATYTSESAKQKGEEAVAWLDEHGIEVTFNDEGWPSFAEKVNA